MEERQIFWDENRLGWLALAWFGSFKSRTLNKLARYFKQGPRALHANLKDLLYCEASPQTSAKFISWRQNIDPLVFSRRCDAEGVRFVLQNDDEFPISLAKSNDPPLGLFIRGAPSNLQAPVAVVGTRNMTPYGERAAKTLTHNLSLAGCEIISGLALGIDAVAHRTALSNHAITVAVLAGGCNDSSIYPKNNFALAKDILNNDGTIISENPPGTESFKHLFPLRNRIIASLCRAVLVVEAAEKSGSLITAKLALEENREVFAVPGPINSEKSAGSNSLLKMGAAPCTSAEDILHLFNLQQSHRQLARPEQGELLILELLDRPLHKNEIVRALAVSAQSVLPQLSALEMKELVQSDGSDFYSRTSLGKQTFERFCENLC
ncbi:MAG: DNA-processing protein DprA [Patescibacteria group bacterium]|nr:DNA-processing protein DprA [Patescibacteria group bacterium]